MERIRALLGEDSVTTSQRLLVGVVLVTLVISGPAVPGVSLTQSSQPTALGEGNATVTAVEIAESDVKITPGRFGTDVLYLRGPDANVQLEGVDGQPRIVYRIEIPALDVETATTRLLAGPGKLTVRLDDRAFLPDQVDEERYDGELTVRIQSFSTDRTLLREQITVEVRQ